MLARAVGPGPAEELDADLCDLAAREGLAPLLGARIARGEIDAGSAGAALARAHREELARGLMRERAVRLLGRALAQAGIPWLLLKGAALERSVYAPGERPMHDVDVLVPAARFADAGRLARGVGAEPLGPASRPVTGRFEYAAAFALPPGVGVEIHRAVGPSPLFAVDVAALFRRASACTDGALVPDATDLFLLLALHAAKHGFCLPFRSVVDGLRLAAAGTVDRGALVARARAFRARRALAAWVGVLESFGLDADFAAAVRAALPPTAVAAAAMLARSAPWPHDGGGWPRRARIALSVEGWRGAGWLLLRAALRVADLVAARS
ncbi:MAG TPA: nucleotidyltransferase family protein [Haliangiales bacterium]|nr:nucleotidyltransferase family protein [Haliangiales bacterium]